MEEIVHKRYKLENLENYDYFDDAINHGSHELSFLSDQYLPSSADEPEKYYWYFIHLNGAAVILSERGKEGFKENYILISGRKEFVDNTKLNLEQKVGKLIEFELSEV